MSTALVRLRKRDTDITALKSEEIAPDIRNVMHRTRLRQAYIGAVDAPTRADARADSPSLSGVVRRRRGAALRQERVRTYAAHRRLRGSHAAGGVGQSELSQFSNFGCACAHVVSPPA